MTEIGMKQKKVFKRFLRHLRGLEINMVQIGKPYMKLHWIGISNLRLQTQFQTVVITPGWMKEGFTSRIILQDLIMVSMFMM